MKNEKKGRWRVFQAYLGCLYLFEYLVKFKRLLKPFKGVIFAKFAKSLIPILSEFAFCGQRGKNA